MNELLKGQMLLIMGELWDRAEIAGIDSVETYTGAESDVPTPEEHLRNRAALIWEAAHKVLTLVNRAQEER